jgi:ribonuclease HI
MNKHLVFFDGGQYFFNAGIPRSQQTVHNTYGVLIHIGQEDPIEFYGKDILPKKFDGMHEYIAFIRCCEVLKKEKINYENVEFYTDCENLAYAPMYLHEDNYMMVKKESLILHMKRALDALDMKDSYDLVMEVLKKGVFHKVKSHRQCVDNMRVDYLAKTAQNGKEKINYQKFLECAFSGYDRNGFFFYNLPFMPTFNKIKIKK